MARKLQNERLARRYQDGADFGHRAGYLLLRSRPRLCRRACKGWAAAHAVSTPMRKRGGTGSIRGRRSSGFDGKSYGVANELEFIGVFGYNKRLFEERRLGRAHNGKN